MRELILLEILAVPAERSRGRHNPRVVKRKMSGFPTKARAAPPSGRVFRYEEHIRIVAPVASPADPAPPLAASKEKPTRCRPREDPAPTGRYPSWLQHVRSWRAGGLSRTAYCECHSLDLRTFHCWVARSRPAFRKARPRSSQSP
jgi:hypothetical protein